MPIMIPISKIVDFLNPHDVYFSLGRTSDLPRYYDIIILLAASFSPFSCSQSNFTCQILLLKEETLLTTTREVPHKKMFNEIR
jgi:hypothetical protein